MSGDGRAQTSPEVGHLLWNGTHSIVGAKYPYREGARVHST